ncbi:hypothetical protein SSX86_008347 [Deinandra increscens subsp. villosa]|uniref:ATP-dependent DNA helicase n=1 Tax=Deinandra increscens subsp. villosa TaxID=3103831 RepID=A0AAP0DCE1_9ASTR
MAQPYVGLRITPGHTTIEVETVTLDQHARVLLVGKEGIPETTHSIVTAPKRKRDAPGDNARPESSKQAFKRATRRQVADMSGSSITSAATGSSPTVGGIEVVGSSHSKVTVSRHPRQAEGDDRQPEPSMPHLKKPTSDAILSFGHHQIVPRDSDRKQVIKLHHQTGTVGPVLSEGNEKKEQPICLQLWEQNWETLCKDIVYRKRKYFRFPNLELTPEQKKSYCLLEIQELLQQNGRSLDDYDELLKPDLKLLDGLDNRLIREELSYDTIQEAAMQQRLCNALNNDQKLIYDHVIDSVQQQKGGLFFVYGLGGTGKTFLYRAIFDRVRSERMIALAVASSGK